MTSSSSKALRLASLPGPPPTPTSLLDLPQPWLLQLATCKGLDRQRATLLALFRTCAFFHDAVLRHRTAAASFKVPIAEEDFPSEVERLSTVARRSSSVRLRFDGPLDEGDLRPAVDWAATEPHVTHLLVCAMAQLEGERPLACVKEIVLWDLEQASLVPAWVKVLCPNATKLDLNLNTLAPHPLPQPRPHQRLQELRWARWWHPDEDPPLAEHMQQQLAALPSLTFLALQDLSWAGEQGEDEQQAGRLISDTVTRLELTGDDEMEDSSLVLQRLPTQFPNLGELDAACVTVDDDGLEALLRLPHLERLHVWGFNLRRGYAHTPLAWCDLRTGEVDVDSFARLPLDSIQGCSGWWLVQPTADVATVVRVAQAVRRWGGLRDAAHGLSISGKDVAALLVTLGPLLAVLPGEQRRRVSIHGLRDATPQQVQQLGQHLPPAVATLRFTDYVLPLEAWAALLPSLPATVEELRLEYTHPDLTEQHMLALCRAAVRPIRVVVSRFGSLSEQDLERIRGLLVGPEQQPSLVTLVADK